MIRYMDYMITNYLVDYELDNCYTTNTNYNCDVDCDMETLSYQPQIIILD